MRARSHGLVAMLVSLLLLLAAWITPVWAHEGTAAGGPAKVRLDMPGADPSHATHAGLLEIVALGAAMCRLRRLIHCDVRAGAAIVATAVLVFAVGVSPHLVHHALDRDQGATCPILQTTERSPGVTAGLDVLPALESGVLLDVPACRMTPAALLPVPRGRAPPSLS
jgi:hypothetical protein